ncbi:MAG: EamA family transporter [Akkermansiaceae bacterium]
MPTYYIWPSLAALIYALAAILTKRALAEGAGVMRYTFLCNVAFFLLFLIPAAVAWQPVQWNQIGWPVLGGLLFFLGQILTVTAIRVGDVSVQSPLMGSKVIFVALISLATGAELVGSRVWMGAALTVVAIFLLGYSSWKSSRRTWIAVGLALASSVAFAASDVLTIAKASGSGVENYLAIVMGVQLLLSVILIPFFSEKVSVVPRNAWPWIAAASGLMALQAITLNVALGHYKHATSFNVIYSSRGLWSVLLIWCFGHLVANRELLGDRKVLVRRLTGATLLLVAVFLILTDRAV